MSGIWRSSYCLNGGIFDQVVILHHSQYLATISDAFTKSDGYSKIVTSSTRKRTSCIQIWDMKDLESDGLAPTNQLHSVPSYTEVVIGAFGARMVLLTTDFWVSSVDLAPAAATDDSFVRHFLVPSDWVTSRSQMIISVGRNGEILFAKHSELAVIKRGLEVTDSGASFNPRRGSATNMLLQARRSSVQQRRTSPSPSPGTSPSRPALPHR